MTVTATGTEKEDRFDLTPADYENDIVRTRLEAAKPVTLPEPAKDVAAQLGETVLQLVGDTDRKVSSVVFANTPRTARDVYDAVRRRLGVDDTDVVLLTGRMRDREAEAARAVVLDRDAGAPAGRDPSVPRAKHLVVVATQTLEVGADLDFDLLVTETASVRALVQRLGRLNRLGERNEVARAVICHPAKPRPGGQYGDEPVKVWERLRSAKADAAERGEELSLGPAAITGILGEPADVPDRVGELLPHHLWEWAKTSVPPVGEAPSPLFYDRVDDEPARVSVAWRAYVPRNGHRLVPPLRGAEAIEVPLVELRQALKGRGAETACRLGADRANVEETPLDRLAPGDLVILPVDIGLYDERGWSPEATGRVLDIGTISARALVLTPAAVAGLLAPPVTARDVTALVNAVTALPRDDEDDEEWADRKQADVQALLDRLAAGPRHPWLSQGEWDDYCDALSEAALGTRGNGLRAGAEVAARRDQADATQGPGPGRRGVTRPTDTVTPGTDADGAATTDNPEDREPEPPFIQAQRVKQAAAWANARADAFDELSFGIDATSRDLGQHLGTVGRSAERIAERLGLPAGIVDAVRRAGEFHDLGKADLRFQRWLDPTGRSEVPLAKSDTPQHRREAARVASGWPRGGRHELLSARLVEENLPADDEHRDLILHLVASHHGHGRPSIPVVPDDAPLKVHYDPGSGEWKGAPVSGDLSLPDWEQPQRFRRLCERYGYWGLALLEAVLRQADHAASAASTGGDQDAGRGPTNPEVL